MKTLLMALLVGVLCLFGCTNPDLHTENGRETIRLECGQKLVNSSINHGTVNFLTRAMKAGEVPETYRHHSGSWSIDLIESLCH